MTTQAFLTSSAGIFLGASMVGWFAHDIFGRDEPLPTLPPEWAWREHPLAPNVWALEAPLYAPDGFPFGGPEALYVVAETQAWPRGEAAAWAWCRHEALVTSLTWDDVSLGFDRCDEAGRLAMAGGQR